LEDGIGSIKILVIVLVVVAQGWSAVRTWIKKQKQRKIEEDARVGIRTDRGGAYSSDDAEAEEEGTPELPDWDPFEDRPRAPELPPIHAETPPPEPPPAVEPVPTPPPAPARKPALIASETNPEPAAERAPLVASIAAVAIQNHRLSDPTRCLRANRTSARLVGEIPLRTAMLAKIVLDRPLSARALGGRLPRA
jgi:hypothetical protein